MLARFLKRPASELPISSVVDPVSMTIHPVESVVKPPVEVPTGAPVISPLAVVDPKAKIGEGCEIGPFCVVGADVELGAGCKLLSHVVIFGPTTIGCNNTFFPNAVIGAKPQDKKYHGEQSRLEIGNRNSIREAVTIHLGTEDGGGVTRVGDDNLLMVNVHLGHDCQVGSRSILSNNVMLAGHVVVGNNVVMSGGAAAHHYVTVGDFAFIAGMAQLHHDVPPFVKLSDKDKIRALNNLGLERAGIAAADIDIIEEAGRRLFFNRSKPMARVLAEFDAETDIHPMVKQLVEFIRRRDSGKHGRYLEAKRKKKV